MRVLVVEDDRSAAETLRRMLIAEGWAVEVTGNGVDGYECATAHHFDAILLDIMMPGLNGYEVVRNLRRAQVWTPVLMVSAKDGDYDQIDAFDFGADDYITKPFSFALLTARLRALVRRGAPERPAVLTAGSLTLDPATHQVTRRDQAVTLTPREYGMLEFLMRKKGTVVSKSEVLRSVWDANYRGDDNIVEVYVSYLRKRIDVPFGCKAIQTVRGVGYLLADDGGDPEV
ncbi:response regulator transcription factor [Williamsia sterculiae]|uniref:response regulator transcription factor n=1 Tax=Williamsia sterculiae TaxID=1344003 RepID=UPI0009708307|nr:response regulator transcription factor [Williamsia sterculiae]